MSDKRNDSCHTDDRFSQHPPTHQNFRWTEGPHQSTPYAEFLEMAIDGNGGIATCLQTAYASDLTREANTDADIDDIEAPAVGHVDSDRLKRMAILMAELLCSNARHRVEELNLAANDLG